MNLKVTQKLPLTIKPVDAKGNLAKVDGVPAWSVSDASLGMIEAAADGMSATVTPVGPIGSFTVQVNADADMGEGVKTLVGEIAIETVAGDAASIEIAAGEAVDL